MSTKIEVSNVMTDYVCKDIADYISDMVYSNNMNDYKELIKEYATRSN